MERKLSLTKDQINGIKYFIRQEEACHKFGDWDRFKITSLRVYANGFYSFKINWSHTIAGIFEGYWVEGNLFDDFPISAVLDGLDAIKLLFHRIHRKAYQRSIERSKKEISQVDDWYDYLKQIYKPGGSWNKENKIISDVRDEENV